MQNKLSQLALRVLWFALAVSIMMSCTVNNKPSNTNYVQQSCGNEHRCFERIQPALDAIATTHSNTWITFPIVEGDFYEKINLHTDRVEGLTVENTFDCLSNDALVDDDPEKIKASQGVALLLDIDSDRIKLNDVALHGNQDTLFANGSRAYIRNSTISGNYDFTFGNGQLLIEDSTIVSRKCGQPMKAGVIHSYFAVPSTQLKHDFGIVFIRSRLTRSKRAKSFSHIGASLASNKLYRWPICRPQCCRASTVY